MSGLLFTFEATPRHSEATSQPTRGRVPLTRSGDGNGADWQNACPDFVGACAVSALGRGNTYFVAVRGHDGTWDRGAFEF